MNHIGRRVTRPLRLAALAAGVLVAATVLAAPGVATAAPGAPVPITVPTAPDARAVDGSYIVRVRDGVDPREVADSLGLRPRYVYTAAINGFAADFALDQLDSVRRRSDVLAISQNVEVERAIDATQNNPTWGIDRIDQRFLPLSNTYSWNFDGSATRVYVIDTGIDTAHPDFEGRALWMHNSIDNNNTDCNSHGTHVAGTVGSATYGVAKKAKLRAVKALNCAGGSNVAALIGAVDWVTDNAIKPAVANTSWNWPADAMLQAALVNMINSGVYLAASAGNTGGDSCDRLPRKIAAALVVANSTSTDSRSATSSTGACVDLYAPGTSIRSTLPGGGNGLKSGTSMATPHAAGVAALYKDGFGDASQATINTFIVGCATQDVLVGALLGTPNKLLNTCGR